MEFVAGDARPNKDDHGMHSPPVDMSEEGKRDGRKFELQLPVGKENEYHPGRIYID
jgi:hypothetical protein